MSSISRGSTRLRGAGRALPTVPRARSRANGRIPDRFAGRSRVVPLLRADAGFQPMPGSLLTLQGGRVPLIAFDIRRPL
jgi:hypothetical protein